MRQLRKVNWTGLSIRLPWFQVMLDLRVKVCLDPTRTLDTACFCSLERFVTFPHMAAHALENPIDLSRGWAAFDGLKKIRLSSRRKLLISLHMFLVNVLSKVRSEDLD